MAHIFLLHSVWLLNGNRLDTTYLLIRKPRVENSSILVYFTDAKLIVAFRVLYSAEQGSMRSSTISRLGVPPSCSDTSKRSSAGDSKKKKKKKKLKHNVT
jgi:hypothetical protein